MIQTSSEYIEQETIRKYVTVIRHFRGYLDKERYADDVAFLRAFVEEVGCPCGCHEPILKSAEISVSESTGVGPYSV